MGERRLEQRAAALAEAAHRRERDAAQLGILRRQRLQQRVLVDIVRAARRRPRPRPRRAGPPATASRAQPRRAATSAGVPRAIGRSAASSSARSSGSFAALRSSSSVCIVARRRVLDETRELRCHHRLEVVVPVALARPQIVRTRSSSTPPARPSRASARCRRSRGRTPTPAASEKPDRPARPPRTITRSPPARGCEIEEHVAAHATRRSTIRMQRAAPRAIAAPRSSCSGACERSTIVDLARASPGRCLRGAARTARAA